MRVDAVIVGARCSGAATALLLARAGARVVLVDKGAYGSDALSTHALMRGAVLQLHRWGLLPTLVAAGTPPVHSTTFSYREQDVTVPIEPRFGVSALYAPRRALLDRTLVDAAADSGADVRYGVRVDDVILDDRGRVRGITAVAGGTRHRIDADMVIGADGLHSIIAQRVGAARVVEGRHSTGVLYSYWEDLPVDGYYWRFRTGASIGAIPTNDGATCVFVSVPSGRFRSEIPVTLSRHTGGSFAKCPQSSTRGSTRHAEWSLYVGSAGRSVLSSAAPGPGGRLSATPGTSRIHSPLTASRTHCAIRNCWRARSCKGQRPHLQTTRRRGTISRADCSTSPTTSHRLPGPMTRCNRCTARSALKCHGRCAHLPRWSRSHVDYRRPASLT